jgi:hypothetical protein
VWAVIVAQVVSSSGRARAQKGWTTMGNGYRVSRSWLAMALLAGCSSVAVGGTPPPPPASAVVGLRCDPPHPPFSGERGEHHCPETDPTASCFVGTEVHLEVHSPQCAGQACIVYHWDESVDQGNRDQRVHCTCRCRDERGDAVPDCACPNGFTCIDAVNPLVGGSEVGGAYCVRSSLPEVGPRDAGR